MPAQEFAQLVLQIARTTIRFARRDESLPGLSGLWDPPPVEDVPGKPGGP